MINTLTLMIVGYMLLQLLIAAYAARGIKNESDFIVAGRTVGLFLGVLSLFATNFGAETIMGSSAAIADEGLAGARADPFGYTICWLLMALFVAYQLRSRAYSTIGDFFHDRYGRRVEMLVAAVVLPSSLIWAAAQMMAFGQIISVVSDVPVDTGIIAATALVVLYTFMGGMKSDILTDGVQGVVLIAGLVALTGFVVTAAGGFLPSLELVERDQLKWAHADESLLARLDVWMIPVLGSLVMQEAVGRLLSMRTAILARRACFIAASLYLVVGCMPVYVGLVGVHLPQAQDLAHRDAYLPDLAKSLLPQWAYVLFIGALVSAIVSTVNSTLLAFAALATKNIVVPLKPALPDATQLRLTRALLLVAGPITCALALGGDTIFEMAQLSSSFGSAGVLVTFFGGMYLAHTRLRAGARTAVATLLTGVAVSALGALVYDEVWEAPFMASILASLVVFVAGGLLERARLPKPSAAA